MKKTARNLVKHFAGQTFKNVGEYQDFVRDHGTLDYVAIDGILFTQDEYDMNGKQISYGNKRTGLGFTIETEDRYSALGFSDATVTPIEDIGCYRNDINYAD